MGYLDSFRSEEAQDAVQYYPGSRVPIIQRPEHQSERPQVDVNIWATKKMNQRKVTLGGVEYTLYTLGALAAALNRSQVTIRNWETNKVIPNPTIVKKASNEKAEAQGRRRLYTKKQIEGLVLIAAQEGILEPDAKGYFKPIRQTRFTERAYQLFRDIKESGDFS